MLSIIFFAKKQLEFLAFLALFSNQWLVIRLHQKDCVIADLRAKLDALLRQQYGQSSEKYPESNQEQLPLFDEANCPAEEEQRVADADISVSAHNRKSSRGGRKPLPAELPRIRVEYDLTDAEKICACGCQLTKIDEECRETLDIIPAKIQVIQHVRLKYACQHCEETVKRALMPAQPIPKSIATPGLLAYILVSKFADHLPLYRQERIFQRMGVDIRRHTLSRWVIQCAELLNPVVAALQSTIVRYDIAFADETRVQVLKEVNRAASQQSYMWLFAGGAPEERCFVYSYHPSRSHEIPKRFLGDFTGYLHTDGYSGYQTLFSIQPIEGVHCWMHARRKFMDIVKTVKSGKIGLCHFAVAHIAKLYRIEALAKKQALTPEMRYQLRLEKSKPLLDEMKQWLDKNTLRVPPDFPIGKAIAYCLKFWPGLTRYLQDGRLEIDNGLSERAIRPFAIGRKNWMFSDTPKGAHAGAIIYSLIETCKAHSVEPYAYLRHVLEKIPQAQQSSDYQALLPFNYAKTIPPLPPDKNDTS